MRTSASNLAFQPAGSAKLWTGAVTQCEIMGLKTLRDRLGLILGSTHNFQVALRVE